MNNSAIYASLFGLAVVVIAVVVWLNLPTYGKMSEEAYQYAFALNSACGRQDAATVKKIEEEILQAEKDGKLQAFEAQWMKSVIEYANQEDWEQAYQMTRELMKAQVSN